MLCCYCYYCYNRSCFKSGFLFPRPNKTQKQMSSARSLEQIEVMDQNLQQQSNAENTAYDCALCEEPNHADHHMVQCDTCPRWFHYSCAGVTDEIVDEPWSCPTCSTETVVENACGGSQEDISALQFLDLGAGKDARWKQNEEQQKAADEQHERDLMLMRKMQRRNFQRQLQREEQKRLAQLELEREMLEMRRKADKEYQIKRSQLWSTYGLNQQSLNYPDANDIPQHFVGGAESRKVTFEPNVYPVYSTPLSGSYSPQVPTTPLRNPGVYPARVIPSNSNAPIVNHPLPSHLSAPPQVPNQIDGRNLSNVPVNPPVRHNPLPNRGLPLVPEEPVNQNSPNQFPHSAMHRLHLGGPVGPCDPPNPPPHSDAQWPQIALPPVAELTRAQIAARKGPFCKLPTFSGDPEEWPLFYSSYINGNLACNWSNLDNLGRLQEAIQNPARAKVRHHLMLPETVPEAIETLRRLYGRPEQIISALVRKAQNAKPPCLENPVTFSDFGIIVQQLTDHLIASGLRDHLVNPHLIEILVAKLPGQTQIEWIRYRRQQGFSTLKTFSDFITAIGADALELEHINRMHGCSKERLKPEKPRADKKVKEKRAEGYLHAHIGEFEDKRASTKREQSAPSSSSSKSVQQQQTRVPCHICNRTDHRTRFCDDFAKLSWEGRVKEVAKWKLCKLCLNEHGDSNCRFKRKCNIGNCHEMHHPLLHPTNNNNPVATTDCNAHSVDIQQPVIYRMVPVRLSNGNHSVNVIAFLDEGASCSLVEREVADQIQLGGEPQPLIVKWTAGMTRMERDSKRVHLSISAIDSSEQFVLKNVHTVEKLKLPEQKLLFADVARKYQHLEGLPVCDYRCETPRILIGLKHLHVYAPLESRIGAPGEPIAVRTHLGWTVYGPQNSADTSEMFSGHHDMSPADRELHELLRSQYMLEEAGIAVSILPESSEDRRARDLLEKTTVRIGQRFETGLLWRDDNPQLPDSYPMAVKRLKALERKLSRNPELKEKVSKQIAEYQEKGYAHKATAQDYADAAAGAKVWYLPLNVVLNPRKPSKVRLVWDAAAAVNGISLNSALLKGPDMLTDLPGVLFHFRERPIAFGGDILEMYHQIGIRRSDKQAQRFLYRDEPTDPPEIFVMDVATFGSTCSPCSAQYIKNRNAKDFADEYPDAAAAIVDNTYVDDYLDSADSVEEAVTRAQQVKKIHSAGGFRIRNWVSNSTEVLEKLEEPTERQVVHFSANKTTNMERILGVFWDPVEDVFRFLIKLRTDLESFMDGSQRPTKRQLGLQIGTACADRFTRARTRWKFNPPSAPHMGGIWRRLLRSTKEAMKALDDGLRLIDEMLLTVLAKAAEMINCRPLTYIPQESSEVEALTPNHFIRGFPSGEHHQVEETANPSEALRDQYKRALQLADILWQRWVKEYVPCIDQPTKWHADSQPVAEGDLVYIADGNSRKTWVRGVVQQIIPGRDGVIRRAVVRLANGKELRRPVNKLAVLEIGRKSSQVKDPALELRAGAMLAPLAPLDRAATPPNQ
ncbi:uncharacterized protein LOC129757483 [Uranotaenia lowii]|uniref:uncharacterized protein LOC129757483 n=1 Tax=Uranotaenia lowii TaxID=190385 RepID=UPI00247A0B7D|nr:uncharacterized protein LOC129757483 [Uranotaenia lowii]